MPNSTTNFKIGPEQSIQQTNIMHISKMNIKLIKGDKVGKAKTGSKPKATKNSDSAAVDDQERRAGNRDETIESISVQKDLTNKIKEINPMTTTMLKSTPDSTTVHELEETTSHSHLKFGSTS